MDSWHAILELAPGAGPEEIRAAYRRLAFRWHPDRNPGLRDEAHRRFLDVSEAYSVLMAGRPRPAAAPPPPSPLREAVEEAMRIFEAQPAQPAGSGVRKASRPLSFREYRARVRRLARDLAAASPRALREDAVMAGTILQSLAFLGLLTLWPAPTGPVPWLLAFAALVTLVWWVSLREQRAERLRPVAEEILHRAGHHPPGGAGDIE